MGLAKLNVEVDDLDLKAINRVVARQQSKRRINGESTLPDGGGNMLGRVLAEICRDLEDYQEHWERDHPRTKGE